MSLRLGIAGAGSIAAVHAEAAARAGVEVAAVCDHHRDRASALAAKHPGAVAAGSLDELLAVDGLDAVTVAVPNDLHKDFATTLRNLGEMDRGTQTELGVFLKRILPDGYPTEHQVTVQTLDGKRRRRAWGIPSLADCRQHFDALTRQKHDWPPEGPDAADADGTQPTPLDEEEVVTG